MNLDALNQLLADDDALSAFAEGSLQRDNRGHDVREGVVAGDIPVRVLDVLKALHEQLRDGQTLQVRLRGDEVAELIVHGRESGPGAVS